MSIAEGGFYLLIAGFVGRYVWMVVSKIFTLLKNKMVYYIHSSSTNSLFWQIESWVNEHEYINRCRNLSVKWDHQKQLNMKTLGYGMHTFKHNGVRLVVYKNQEDTKESYELRETYFILMLTRKREYLEQWLKDIRECYDRVPYTGTKVYMSKVDYPIEKPIANRFPTLEGDTYEDLTKDIEYFLGNEKHYNDLGIPWKRGYLLYGPPGNGKTTTIVCLAQRLKKHVKFVNLSEINNADLVNIIANLEKDTIIVLEDIDCVNAVQSREGEQEGDISLAPKVSLNVLLNCLDGLLTRHGMITFATTNHIEKLDKALIRAGRMDRRIEFKNATREQAEKYYGRFFPGEDATQFADNFTGKPMCELEEYVVRKLSNEI
jgi:chaperone BCS1